MAVDIQVKLKNGSPVTVDLKSKAKCKFCGLDIYWARMEGCAKTMPIDLVFDKNNILLGARSHFSVCKNEKKRKAPVAPDCPLCKGKEFGYILKRDKKNIQHVLRQCKTCDRRVYVPVTQDVLKQAQVEVEAPGK